MLHNGTSSSYRYRSPGLGFDLAWPSSLYFPSTSVSAVIVVLCTYKNLFSLHCFLYLLVSLSGGIGPWPGWRPSVVQRCCLGRATFKIVSEMSCNVSSGKLNRTILDYYIAQVHWSGSVPYHWANSLLPCICSQQSRRKSCRNRLATRPSVRCLASSSTSVRTTRASALHAPRTNSTKCTRLTQSASPCQPSYVIRKWRTASGCSRREPRKLSSRSWFSLFCLINYVSWYWNNKIQLMWIIVFKIHLGI